MANPKIEQIKDGLRQLISSIEGRKLSDQEKLTFIELVERSVERIRQLKSEEQQAEVQVAQATPMAQSPMGADLLWILSGGQPEIFAAYLRQVPDPTLNALALQPSMLNAIILRFQQQMPQGVLPTQDGIEKSALQSSNVWGSRYDPKKQKLVVRFNKGQVYEYDQVPPVIAQLFQAGAASAKTKGRNQFGAWWVGKNPSAGASVHQYLIAGGYPYKRIK